MLAALAQNWRARAGIARLSAHPREIEDAKGIVGGTIGISCLQAVARLTSTPWFPDEAPSYIGRWRSCSDRRSGATLSIRFAHFETVPIRTLRLAAKRADPRVHDCGCALPAHPARIRNARTCAKMRCSNSDAGWSSPVARWAHNPKVAGSNPAPATTFQASPSRWVTIG